MKPVKDWKGCGNVYRALLTGQLSMENDVMKNERRAFLTGRYAMDNSVVESPTSLKPIAAGESKATTKSMFNKEKWLPMVYLPFRISHKCCGVMKKNVLHDYQKEHEVVPIVGTMAEESRIRRQGWMRTGCNAFDGAKSKSQPMSFWTEQDVLAYIVMFGLEIAPVYGDIVCEDKSGLVYQPDADTYIPGGSFKLHTTGVDRTGCMFCAFSLHLEKGETRFQRMKRTHPRQYEYSIGGGQWIDNPDYIENCPEYDGVWLNWNPERIWVPSKEGLGFGKVFDMCNDIYGEEFYRYK